MFGRWSRIPVVLVAWMDADATLPKYHRKQISWDHLVGA
jgi:hypothetical protein